MTLRLALGGTPAAARWRRRRCGVGVVAECAAWWANTGWAPQRGRESSPASRSIAVNGGVGGVVALSPEQAAVRRRSGRAWRRRGRGGWRPGRGHGDAGCQLLSKFCGALRRAGRCETASPACPTRAVGSARRVPVFASPSAGRAPILGSSCSPDCHAVFAHVCRSRGRHSAAARRQKYAQNRAACALQHCRVWRRRPMACVGSACVSVCLWS